MEQSSSPTGPEPPPVPMEGRAAGDCNTGIPKSPPSEGGQHLLPSTTSPPPNTSKGDPVEITPLLGDEL